MEKAIENPRGNTKANQVLVAQSLYDPKLWGGEASLLSTLENAVCPGLEHVSGLNFLVKFIHTHDWLSVQVHPDEVAAKRHNLSNGKSECWLVLEADAQAQIYLGMKPGVTLAQVETALTMGTIVDLLTSHQVREGDFISVPAGVVHALGPGIKLLEVQQRSGTTYRFWDFARKDGKGRARELHIGPALESLRLDLSPRMANLDLAPGPKDRMSQVLIDLPYFSCQLMGFEKDGQWQPIRREGQARFLGLIALGPGEVEVLVGGEKIKVPNAANFLADPTQTHPTILLELKGGVPVSFHALQGRGSVLCIEQY